MLKIFKWYDSYVEWFICYEKNKKKYGIKFIYSRFNVLKSWIYILLLVIINDKIQ